MALFLIDGYNVIRSVDWLARGPLRDQRERLLRFLEDRRPQGKGSVVVVFDGQVDVSSPRWGGTTRVIFASGEADPVLKRLVDEMSNPSEAVVVSDDRAIQRWVRAAGARIMSCRVFLAEGRSPTRRSASSLSSQDVEDINEELRDLWKLD